MMSTTGNPQTAKNLPYRLLAALITLAVLLTVTATPLSRAHAQTASQSVGEAKVQLNAATSCLGVNPHILPQKNTTPTTEQLWVVVSNGCSTVAQGGQVAITDSIRCGLTGAWQAGYSTTVALPSLQPGQSVTPWTIGVYNTGCSGTGPSGPEEEWLHADAQAHGPSGEQYTGAGDAYYTFS